MSNFQIRTVYKYGTYLLLCQHYHLFTENNEKHTIEKIVSIRIFLGKKTQYKDYIQI